jgi:hypothetical protein
MTLPSIWSPNQGSGSWWHSQEKGGLITSQPSHFREILVGNAVTSGHHARTVSPIFSLEKKKIPKEIRLRIKGIEWARKQWHP